MAASDTVLLFDAGVGTAQGGRPSQEDRYVLLLPDRFPHRSMDKIALFGVFDGHGSAMVSEHVKKHLPDLLTSRPEFDAGDYETAIAKALEDEDAILLESVMSEDTEPVVAGTTVALCLVNLTKGVLTIGNLGDSHIVFAERDTYTDTLFNMERLTKAHKPNVPSERSRIEEAGGAVRVHGGSARLGNGSSNLHNETMANSCMIRRTGTLNMSRAIGDLQYKNPVNTLDLNRTEKSKRANAAAPEARGNFLSNEPHVRSIHLDRGSRYVLFLSTDGVSDTTNEKLLMEHVMTQFKRGQRATDIAREVTALTAGTPESDNCTCIVAFFDGIHS